MLAGGIFSKNRINKTDLCFFNYLRFFFPIFPSPPSSALSSSLTVSHFLPS